MQIAKKVTPKPPTTTSTSALGWCVKSIKAKIMRLVPISLVESSDSPLILILCTCDWAEFVLLGSIVHFVSHEGGVFLPVHLPVV